MPNIAIRIGDSIFSGEYIKFTNTGNIKRLYLKQSSKSQILISFPIDNIHCIITMDSKQYCNKDEIYKFLEEL